MLFNLLNSNPESVRLRHTGASILSGADSVRSSRAGSRAGEDVGGWAGAKLGGVEALGT